MIRALVLGLALSHVVAIVTDVQRPSSPVFNRNRSHGGLCLKPIQKLIGDFTENPELNFPIFNGLELFWGEASFWVWVPTCPALVNQCVAGRHRPDVVVTSDIVSPDLLEITRFACPSDQGVNVFGRRLAKVSDGHLVGNLALLQLDRRILDPDVCSGLCVSNAPGIFHHVLSSYQGVPDQDYSSNGEDCHDPLCKRIARANERPEKPIPKLAYLAVVLAIVGAGTAIGLLLGKVIEPNEHIER